MRVRDRRRPLPRQEEERVRGTEKKAHRKLGSTGLPSLTMTPPSQKWAPFEALLFWSVLPLYLALFCVGCAAKMPFPATVDAVALPASSAVAPSSGMSQGPSELVLGASDRVLIYEAELSITVLDVDAALASAQKQAVQLGGFLQALADTSIQVRVPASRFEEAVGLLSELGSVTSRRISAEDITEEMLDLDIRLETAQEMRKRLLAILKQCETVEDTLAVEKELGRVTTEIERLEGRVRFLQERVDFSSIRVSFNPAVPPERLQRLVPFPWVRELAEILDASRPASRRVKGRSPIDLPRGFVRYRQSRDRMEAISAQNVVLAFRIHDNLDTADLEYWRQVVLSYLPEVRHIVIDDVEGRASAEGGPKGGSSLILEGRRGSGSTAVRYGLGLAVTEKRLYVVELFGGDNAMDEHDGVIESILNSL